MKKALIFGITGQDGSYLAEHLLGLGYAVHGLVRRASLFNRGRIDHLRAAAGGEAGRFELHYGDLTGTASLRRVLKQVEPDEIYHLAGQSHVGLSFELAEATCQENGMATLALLEILRDLRLPVRLYHASSSEIFGRPAEAPQDETTPLQPVNPYGCAKSFATQVCRVYRESYGMFIANGIAYNHESPRRGENFVTRKVTSAAARIRSGADECLVLGNLDAERDWGYAPEYVEAMWRMLQAVKPADYVLATGRGTRVRDFTCAAFAALDLPIEFSGQGVDEIARRSDTGKVVLRVGARYFRPAEPGRLVGDPRRAATDLGWQARTSALEVAALMARAESWPPPSL